MLRILKLQKSSPSLAAASRAENSQAAQSSPPLEAGASRSQTAAPQAAESSQASPWAWKQADNSQAAQFPWACACGPAKHPKEYIHKYLVNF